MEIMAFDGRGDEVLPEGYLAALKASTASGAGAVAPTGGGGGGSGGGGNAANPFTSLTAPGLRKQQLSWEEICNRGSKIVSFLGRGSSNRFWKPARRPVGA